MIFSVIQKTFFSCILESQNEVIYCADIQANSCGCLDDDDNSIVTGGESNDDDDDDDDVSDDEQTGKIIFSIKFFLLFLFIEWQINPSLSSHQFDETEIDKEMQSLLFK